MFCFNLLLVLFFLLFKIYRFSKFDLTSYFGMSSKIMECVEKYDGSRDFREWIVKLELVAELEGKKELEKLLPLFLENGALAVYQRLSVETKKDFQRLKSAMTTAFSLSPTGAFDMLKKRTLQSNESVDVYWADVDRLVKLIDEEASEKFVRTAFISGLPEPMRSDAAGSQATMDELVGRVRIAVENERRSRDASQAFVEAAAKTMRTSQQQHSYPNDRPGGNPHNHHHGAPPQQYHHYNHHHQKRQNEALSPQQRNTIQLTQTTDQHRSGKIICFRCGCEGHISRNCELFRNPAGRNEQRCFICGEQNHLANQCPNRQKNM